MDTRIFGFELGGVMDARIFGFELGGVVAGALATIALMALL
jgi:hypothetical protein